jgi:Na+(H+)/acetate symporter ActP
VELPQARTLTFPRASRYTLDGAPGRVPAGAARRLGPGELVLPAGTPVPVTEGTTARVGEEWSQPVGGAGGGASPLLVYSLLLATFLGTMGLPHILVRFHTSPDGHAARRTTVRVLGLLGLFYLFPFVYSLLGRVLVPQLYVTGDTDLVVLKLPQAAWPGLGGDLLAGLTAAGAFAAFLSTSSGLLISIAGTLSHDLSPRLGLRPPGPRERFTRFRVAAAGGMVLPGAVALLARDVDISLLVGWAFALAASTFCPLFLLGIWWTRLTARGAAAGMLAGAGTATVAIFAGLAAGEPTAGLGPLLAQPAMLTVPIAFATMVLVSLRGLPPPGTRGHMLALHAPEGLGLEARRRALAERPEARV